MNPDLRNPSVLRGSARAALLATALSTGFAGAQTIAVDPADAVPATHSQVFAAEWNVDGNTESWTTSQFDLEVGAPVGGVLTGTANNTDPQLIRGGLNLISSPDTIIEFRLKKQTADTSRTDLFWGDDNGGISGARLVSITPPTLVADDAFHVYRITFSGQITGNLSQFRFDITSDAAGKDKSVSVDYFRVYSVLPAAALSWDPGITGTATAGGAGTWNTSTNSWWNGSAQIAWPATSSGADEATFAGTAGTVTIVPGGVTAAKVNFNTGGYTVTGGPLTLDGAAILRTPGGTTTLDAPLAGSDPITVTGTTLVVTQPGTQSTSTRFNNTNTAASVDDAFGTGGVILGNGGNFFLASLGAIRTHTNDFEWRGNRFIVNNVDHGTGLGAFDLVMDGGLFLAGTAPSDFFLRRNLTVNGKVSGTGPAGRSLYFAGDANTMTLNHAANDFTGTLRWDNATTLAVVADGSLGDPANALSFNGGTGGVRLLAAFDSARPITVSGATAARIDTNGFDSEWSGGVTGANAVNSRLIKQGAGKLTLKGTNFLGGGTQVQGGTLELPADATLTHGNTWDNFHGVNENAIFRLNGGTMLVNGSFYAVGRGTGSGEGLFQIDSGTYTHNGGQVLVGFGGNGRFVMNGGTAVINQLAYGDGTATRTAVAELNGGTLTMDQAGRRGGDSVATIKFNGTTVIAKTNKADFLPVGSAGVTNFLVSAGGAKFDSAGVAINIASQLQHDPALAVADGGLTKLGAGTLSLSNSNSYTGPTTVAAGTLLINGFSLADTGALTVESGGRLGGNGETAAPVTVQSGGGLVVDIADWTGAAGTGYSDLATASLDLSGVTWNLAVGSATSYANFTEANASFTFLSAASITGFNPANVTVTPAGFTGTGTWSVSQAGNTLVLRYTTGSGSPYSTWIDSFTTLTDPADRLPGANPDGDGATNFEEFAFAGDPTSGANDGVRHSQLSGGKLVLTVAVRNGAAAVFPATGSPLAAPFDGVNYSIGGSMTLAGFGEAVNKLGAPVLGPLNPTPPAGYDYASFELAAPVSGNPKGFLRATATP
jgi:fibronectin-binding autotransporter adhesin